MKAQILDKTRNYKTMEEIFIPEDDLVDFTNRESVQRFVARQRALTLEATPKIGEGGMLAVEVPTFGQLEILQEPTATAIATPDLASVGLDLCASCNAKVAAFLEQQRKRLKTDASVFDASTGDIKVSMTSEDARMTSCGLLAPEWSENIFQDDAPSLTLGGLRRPDAGMPDENIEQLRQLMLSRPAPKQPSRKLSLEALRQLGFVQDNDPVSVPDHLVCKGGLICPDF